MPESAADATAAAGTGKQGCVPADAPRKQRQIPSALARAVAISTLIGTLAGCSGSGLGANPAVAPIQGPVLAEASGIAGRLIIGYQGWFGCPGDFQGNPGWSHWFNGTPAAGNFIVDMLPDTSGMAAEDLCETGLTRLDGTPLRLFSSQTPNVVAYHFALMAQQGASAVALERFVSELADPSLKARRDNVLRNVIRAAQSSGIKFFLSYDVSGADPATVTQTIRDDWQYLDASFGLTQDPNYLHDGGKPVLELWGFGIIGHPGTPVEVAALLTDLGAGNNGLRAATTIGGVAADWSTLDGDAQADPAWTGVYRKFDVLSPWTVGRYDDPETAASFYASNTGPDAIRAARDGKRLLPVIFPGFSWYNLMTQMGLPAMALINQIPRKCGSFVLAQSQILLAHGVNTAFVAMFDELNESTAMMPAAALADSFPQDVKGVYLDIDGCKLATDHFDSILGQLARLLRAAPRSVS